MKIVPISLLAVLFFLVSPADGYGQARVSIDTSAIGMYWEVVDTLSSDRMPSKHLWEKMEKHPAYLQSQQSGNRMSFLKKVLPIVYKPSNARQLKALLAGEETPYQYFALHLINVQQKRQALNKYLHLGKFDDYKTAYQKSLAYLPEDIDEDKIDLTIYLALFEDNGFGGKVITIDLLHLYYRNHQENFDFFAHEFHHSLRSSSTGNTLYAPDTSTYYPIIQALNKLPLEGVASLLDKQKYFDEDYFSDTSNISSSQLATVQEFRALVANTPSNLYAIDSILVSDVPLVEKGKSIFQQLPWSGHAVGFYMSRAIEKELGRPQLIQAQYSCLDFCFLYQQAALKDASLYKFSDGAIAFLESIE